MSRRTNLVAKVLKPKKENSISQNQKNNFCYRKNLPVDQRLRLQRTFGNQAVQRLFKSGVIQVKSRIGKPGNIYEQEVDRIAEQVMCMPEPNLQKQPHNKEEEEKEEENMLQTKEHIVQTSKIIPNLESKINAMNDGGHPLLHPSRTFFELRFGYDFSKVRVHTNSQAAELSKAVDARAFTKENNIYFGSGFYNPGALSGKKLLAHELTHVIQQSDRNKTKIYRKAKTEKNKTKRRIEKESDPLSSYPFLQKVLNKKDKFYLRKLLKIRTKIRQIQTEMYQFAEKEGINIWPPYGISRGGVMEKMDKYHERIRILRVKSRSDDLELPALRLCYRGDIAPSPSDPNYVKLAKDRIIARLTQMKIRIFVEDPDAVIDIDNKLRIFLEKYEVSQTFGEIHFKDLLLISEFRSIVSEEKDAEKRREQVRARKVIEKEKERVKKARTSEEFENLGWTEFTTDFLLDYAFRIKAEAVKQNIDPIAIAGVVAWEREVNWKGYWSDVIYQRKQCAKGTISQTAGIGYGSIHLGVAEALEKAGRVPVAANIRIRCQRLQDPTWAIRYIGAIMNQDAKNYENIAGINIRNRPDILATLYRTGKSRIKARNKKMEIDRWKKGGKRGSCPIPMADEMGVWIRTHFNDIRYLLGI